MVPLNSKALIIDLIKALDVEVVLVSRNYLGSINHTLLSFEALKQKGISVKGIVFNGKSNVSTEEYILNYTKLPCLLRVNEEPEINKEIIQKYASQLKY
jgi:dethiobiotin synthetase